MSSIGFIGLGRMGTPMAARLAAAGPLIVYDIDADRTAAFAAEHSGTHRVEAADNPKDLAARADVIITMLPTSAIVRDAVWTGDQSCRSSLKAGQLIIDMSSSDPADTKQLGEDLQSVGVGLVDAPVSGGVKRAVAGTLAVLVGGDSEEDVDRAAGLLGAVGDPIVKVGALGSGHIMKALNNLLSATTLAASAEVLAAGAAAGINPNVMLDVLNASSGRNNSTETKIRQFVYSGTFGSGFALDLMVKDLDLADAILQRSGTSASITSATRETWKRAQSDLSGHDHTEIAAWLGAPAGHDKKG
ncbi:MAG: NAD(P)-dependent oxidoreductase [Pseudomonadota bacterium]